MREIFIKYNPYQLETTVLIDGAAPKQNSRLNVGEHRLQEWVEELPDILFEECSSRDFKLTFHGTILDYEDIEAMARTAKKKELNFELEHIVAQEVEDKETAISDIFDEIQEGPFEELKQADVKNAFEQAKSNDFKVNVVATMSAGKSTLINALLRQKLMPAKQEACTATITEIRDNDNDGFSARAFDRDGTMIKFYQDLSFDVMESLNSDLEVSRIRVEGNIPFVSSEDISLVLVDTPGPNNSRDPQHKAATYRMLSESSKPLVLYILNATQLAINDDNNLLGHVADSMKVGGKQSRDRFIFVLNKLDDFKKGEDNIKDSIAKVRDYLKDHGIEDANIYPASSLTALNIRTILSESDDDDDDDVYETKGLVRKFNRNEEMHFETLAPLTPSMRGEIERRLTDARNNKDTHEEALIHCGIVPIEMAIQTYVRKYAKTAKIKNIVDTFSNRLESAKSFEITRKEIAENQDQQKEILANIAAIKKKLASGEEAKSFKKKVEQIKYDDDIKKLANETTQEAQKKIRVQLSSADSKIRKQEAEELCRQWARFADNLQVEVEVKLEELITNHVHKNASDLLEEYKKKISELSKDMPVGSVSIDPFELMKGEVSIDVSSLIDKLTETESVKIGETWVKNPNKKWYKPWTWFQESGHWEAEYENKEYVNGTKLAERFFTPFQEQLYENSNNSVEYAKEQARKIKKQFLEKFDKLDDVLKEKLKELEDCANNNKAVEKRIRESQTKLKWLEDIQAKTKSILDI